MSARRQFREVKKDFDVYFFNAGVIFGRYVELWTRYSYLFAL